VKPGHHVVLVRIGGQKPLHPFLHPLLSAV
jgi:hypothetical protein